jgi:uncharacterized protein (DUF433 family)
MNGEPFCYGTRLTVRNVLQMRSSGLTPAQMLAENPELKQVGIAEAFSYAASHRARYADFFENDGTLRGLGFTAEEAARLPEDLRAQAGIVVSRGEPAPVGTHR